jgi:hypothetical protein
MSEDRLDPDTPASPHPDAATRHGDALLDGSGSRHGTPPQESALPDGKDSEDEES